MKKIIISLLLAVLLSSVSYSQVKVNLYMTNPGISSGYWKIDLMATVLAGQNWRVGSSNIRVDFVTTPTGAATIKLDNPAINPNPNLHNNANYGAMTTTSILGGTAISLNITRFVNCYNLTPGSYKLGELRFNRIDTNGCIRLTIRANTVMQDSITQMLNPTNWTFSTDTSCIRLDGFTGINPVTNEIPTVYKLYNNYPNPFNPATTIKYDVPENSYVSITVFDILGKEMNKLVNRQMQPGRYEVVWEAGNFASGTYFYKFESGSFTDIKKMVLVK